MSLRYAAWLQNWGVEKDDIVALDFQNTDSFVFLIFALWSLGARPALINYNLTGNPLIHCLKKATAKLVIIDPTVAGKVGDDVRSEFKNTRFEVLTDEARAEIMKFEPVTQPNEPRLGARSEDMAALIYTSGTTGLPKAAVVSWAKLVVAGEFSRRFIGVRSTDVYYTVSPVLPTLRHTEVTDGHMP